jgi:hypothetical protein
VHVDAMTYAELGTSVVHRSLTQLNLAGCSQLRDVDLPCVGELTSLRELRLARCGLLTDEGDRPPHCGSRPDMYPYGSRRAWNHRLWFFDARSVTLSASGLCAAERGQQEQLCRHPTADADCCRTGL